MSDHRASARRGTSLGATSSTAAARVARRCQRAGQDGAVAPDPRSVLTRSARAPDVVLAYGPEADHLGEVWWPSSTQPDLADPPSALVLVLHGGFWQAEWDRAHARPLAAALADAGHVVGSVEYRRVGSPGGGWPGTFDDVAAAVDQLPRMIMSAAPEHGRTAGVVLVGHSAGGQLALWAAARHRLKAHPAWCGTDAAVIRGVVALAPVAALARAGREDLGEGAVAELLGGHVADVPDRYAAADPDALAPSGVRTVVVHGERDRQVPIAHSRSYVQQARAAGDDITLVELPGTEHFALIDPLSPAWPTVRDAVRLLATAPAAG